MKLYYLDIYSSHIKLHEVEVVEVQSLSTPPTYELLEESCLGRIGRTVCESTQVRLSRSEAIQVGLKQTCTEINSDLSMLQLSLEKKREIQRLAESLP